VISNVPTEIAWIEARFVILVTTVVMHLMKEVATKKELVKMIIWERVEVANTDVTIFRMVDTCAYAIEDLWSIPAIPKNVLMSTNANLLEITVLRFVPITMVPTPVLVGMDSGSVINSVESAEPSLVETPK
jgi:hypothetical protein